MGSRDDDFEILAALDALSTLAASSELTKRLGEPAVEVRARATLALALFMPHHAARKSLTDLIATESTPEEVRSVATEALGNWSGS